MTDYIRIYDYPKATMPPVVHEAHISPWIPAITILIILSWHFIKIYLEGREAEALQREFNEYLESCAEEYR